VEGGRDPLQIANVREAVALSPGARLRLLGEREGLLLSESHRGGVVDDGYPPGEDAEVDGAGHPAAPDFAGNPGHNGHRRSRRSRGRSPPRANATPATSARSPRYRAFLGGGHPRAGPRPSVIDSIAPAPHSRLGLLRRKKHLPAPRGTNLGGDRDWQQ